MPIFPTGYPEKNNLASTDKILVSDSENNNQIVAVEKNDLKFGDENMDWESLGYHDFDLVAGDQLTIRSVNRAKMRKNGNRVDVSIDITIDGPLGGNYVVLHIPVIAIAYRSRTMLGLASYFDASATLPFTGIVSFTSVTSTFTIVRLSTLSSPTGDINPNSPFTWVGGDGITAEFSMIVQD